MTVYYKRNTNPTNTNWNQADNWSTVSSASSTNSGTYPTGSGDSAIFDAGSSSITVNTGSTTGVLDMRNYTNTVTLTQSLTLSTLSTTHYFATGVGGGFAGTAYLYIAGSCTINPGNHSSSLTPFSGGFAYNSTSALTVTLGGNLYISGNLAPGSSGSAATHVLNGNTIYVAGSLTHFASCNLTGTTNIVMNGTGTWSAGSATVYYSNNIEINTAGTFSIAAGASVGYKTGILKYTAGTVSIDVTSTLFIQGSMTLNTPAASVAWGKVTISGSPTITLSSGPKIAGLFTPGTVTTFSGNYIVELSGGATLSSVVTGASSAALKLSGGTFYGSALNINTSVAGNVTFGSGASSFAFGGALPPTLTYTSGTVTMGAIGTTNSLTIGGNATLSSGWNATTFNNFGSNATATLTLNSDINISGLFNLASTLTINGAYNVNVSGGFPTSGSGTLVSGSAATVVFKGGTYHNSSLAFNGKLTINPVGTVTLGNCVMQSGGYLKYVAGAGSIVNNSGSNYINLYAGTTLDVNGIPAFWNILYFSNAGTYTLASDFHCNTMQFVSSYAVIFSGAYDIYCLYLSSVAAGTGGSTLSLVAGRTLNISAGINFQAQVGSTNTINSATPSSKTYIKYTGTTLNNLFNGRTAFVDIDASGGAPLYSINGSATRCVNARGVTGADIGGGGLKMVVN